MSDDLIKAHQHNRMIDWWADTYVFYSWNEKEKNYIECFNQTNSSMQDIYDCFQKDKNFQNISIFNNLQLVELFPNKYNKLGLGYDKKFEIHQKLYLDLFTDVFDLTGQNRWKFKRFKIILPKKEFQYINRVIEKYNLFEINDLIFELIAVAQEFYITEVFVYSYDEKPISRKTLKQKLDADKKRMTKDLDVLAKSFEIYNEYYEIGKNKNVPPVIKINFNIKGETLEIKNQFIVYGLIERLKNSFESDSKNKDWKTALTFLNVAESFRKNADFNEKFAFALHDLIIKGDFKLNKKNITNYRIMEFIVDIFDCIQIPIGNFNIRALDSKRRPEKLRIKTISRFFDNRSSTI